MFIKVISLLIAAFLWASPSTHTSGTHISADEARSIALAHAGLTAAEVRGLRAEKDRDDGVWVYEVEFRHGRTEYDYEIHAVSGKIREYEKDRD